MLKLVNLLFLLDVGTLTILSSFFHSTSLTRLKPFIFHMFDIKDKIKRNLTSHGEFSVKSTTWANNEKITSHPTASFSNSIWKLNFTPKIKIYAWKLVYHFILKTHL